MKKTVLFVSAFLIALSPLVSQEKTPDKTDFMINSRAASVLGTLDGPETYNRIFGCSAGVSLTCNFVGCGLSSPGSNVFYDVYEIYTSTGENLVATLESNDFDTYLSLYCDPFNPATPLINAVFADDDDGVGLNSAFLPGDNVYLEPNTSYFLVVSSFGNGESGDYTLTLDGNVVLGSPQPPPVPLSKWALYLGIFLIVMFTAIRFRRMI